MCWVRLPTIYLKNPNFQVYFVSFNSSREGLLGLKSINFTAFEREKKSRKIVPIFIKQL